MIPWKILWNNEEKSIIPNTLNPNYSISKQFLNDSPKMLTKKKKEEIQNQS